MPLAEAKRLDIGLVTQQDVVVHASEIDLTMLVRNLVDNAIRYTPEGGRIDLSVEIGPDGAAFAVRDTGPGIPPDDRERVSTRSIACSAAMKMDRDSAFPSSRRSSIALTRHFPWRIPRRGLEVTVTIPKALIRNAYPDRTVADARRTAAGRQPDVN